MNQRVLYFITVSKYVGWNYSPAYNNYKLLAIPSALARMTGITDALYKPIGFNVPALITILNEYLHQAQRAQSANPEFLAQRQLI